VIAARKHQTLGYRFFQEFFAATTTVLVMLNLQWFHVATEYSVEAEATAAAGSVREELE
jgi:hypothetical protein